MLPKQSRRAYLATVGTAAASIGLAGCQGGGDEFPSQEITWVVPSPPGTTHDAYARQIAEVMPDHLPNDVNIVVENEEGAGETRALNRVVDSEPDGYTIGISSDTAPIIQLMLGRIDIDLTELSWVGNVVSESMVLVANPDSPYDSIMDLDGADETIRIATGDPHHAFLVPFLIAVGELGLDFDLEVLTGYDDLGGMTGAVLRGDAHLTQSAISSGPVRSMINDGELKAILWYHTEDLDVDPDAPNATDVGNEDVAAAGTRQRAVYGPPEIEQDRLDTLESAFVDACASDEVQSWAEESGNPVHGDDAEATLNQVQNMMDLMENNSHIFE